MTLLVLSLDCEILAGTLSLLGLMTVTLMSALAVQCLAIDCSHKTNCVRVKIMPICVIWEMIVVSVTRTAMTLSRQLVFSVVCHLSIYRA